MALILFILGLVFLIVGHFKGGVANVRFFPFIVFFYAWVVFGVNFLTRTFFRSISIKRLNVIEEELKNMERIERKKKW